MPKIIFRPNPTPPPFVPPTPSYDTQINAVSKYPYYNDSESLELKFSPAQVPPFDVVKIFRDNSEIAQGITNNLPTTAFFNFETTTDGETPFTGEIKFYKDTEDDGQIHVWTATLIVSYP